MTHSPQQLPLAVALRDDATFHNYYMAVDSPNQQLLAGLQLPFNQAEQFVYVWGASGCGLTHLLQAACHAADQQGLAVFYLPLKELKSYPPEVILADLDGIDLVCIDDLQEVAGDEHWEKSLFYLYNRMRDAGSQLLISADRSPREQSIALKDLLSRLQWGIVYQVSSLSDDDKIKTLQLRAAGRGLELSDDVARFLLNHLPRDNHKLFAVLDQLDNASLAEQRKLTIPFVKQVLAI